MIPLQKAADLPAGPKRTATLAAWIQGLFRERIPVLVGGAAVELYTGGSYTTGDLDFVGQVPPDVARALENEGFGKRAVIGYRNAFKSSSNFLGQPLSPVRPRRSWMSKGSRY